MAKVLILDTGGLLKLQNMDAGGATSPKILRINGGAQVSLAAGAGVSKVIYGSNLLQGQPLGSMVFNGFMQFTENRPGSGVTVHFYTDWQGGSGPAVITVTGKAIDIHYFAQRSALNIEADINGNALARALVSAAATAGTNPAGSYDPHGVTPLSVETNKLSVKINGVEQDVYGSSETEIALVIKDLTGLSAGDVVSLDVTSNSVAASPMPLTIIT